MLTNTHHSFHYLLNKELTEIYITHSLRSFAVSMVGIFVPIFFLKLNFSFTHVLMFYFFQSLIQIFLYLFLSKIPSKIGVKHSIFISMPFLISFFIIMYNLEFLRILFSDIHVILLSSVAFSFAMFFYWFAFHVDFVKFTTEKTEGQQIGILQALTTLFSVLGPLSGGLIITFYSFNTLFMITSIILILSTIPLFFSSDMRIVLNYKIKNIFKFDKFSNNKFFFAEGARQESAVVFWPMFLFFIAIEISSVGALYTLTNFLLAIFSVFVGRMADVFNKSLLMRVGSILHALSLTLRTFVRSIFLIFSIQSIGAISFPFLAIPYTSIMYNNARRKGIALFIINREVFFHLGRIFCILLCLILYRFLSVETALISSIIFGSICAITMSFSKETETSTTGH